MNAVNAVVGYAASNQLEALGALAGLVCVWCLMRQNIWTWPFGLVYAFISIYLFWQQSLYGQLALHVYFVVMNAYGWYYWLYGKREEGDLLVSSTPWPTFAWVLGLAVLGSLLLAVGFGHFTDSQWPYLDFPLTVLSVAAMWLQAQKKIENWWFWIVVDVAYVGMFWVTANYFYLLLYLIYVPMAIEGLRLWQRSRRVSELAAAQVN